MKRALVTLTAILLMGLAAASAPSPGESKRIPPKPLNPPAVTPVKPAEASSPGKPRPSWRLLKLAPKAPQVRVVPAVPSKVTERVRKVVALKHVPAADVVESIHKLLESERPSRMDEVAIVPQSAGNQLLVSASPAMLEAVLGMVEKIDVRPKCVVIEAVIAEVVREDKAAGGSPLARFQDSAPSQEQVAALIEELEDNPDVEILATPMVTTLDNQAAFIQLGRRVPRVKTATANGGQKSSVEYENVGLLLGVTPRVSGDNQVTMEIDLEKSELASQGPQAKAAAPVIDVIMAQSTITTENGQPLVLAGLKAQTSASAKEVMLIVTPRVLNTVDQ